MDLIFHNEAEAQFAILYGAIYSDEDFEPSESNELVEIFLNDTHLKGLGLTSTFERMRRLHDRYSCEEICAAAIPHIHPDNRTNLVNEVRRLLKADRDDSGSEMHYLEHLKRSFEKPA